MRILASATTALRRIIDLGLVILIVIALFGIVLGKGAPLVGRQTIVIGGGSMEPTIGLGAAIVVKPVDPAALAAGDIVSMQVGPERTTYTHRIIAVIDRGDGRWIQTKGDANAEPDPSLVPASAIIGRAELAIPLAGYLLALLSLPMGVMFVLGLAATLLAMAWLLESIEPEPRSARRRERPADAREPVSEAAGPGTTAAMPSAVDPGMRSGEPVPARPERQPAYLERLPARPDSAPAWLLATPVTAPALGAAATPVRRTTPQLRSPEAPSRPTVRAQIERSREVRRRRASWLVGGGNGRASE